MDNERVVFSFCGLYRAQLMDRYAFDDQYRAAYSVLVVCIKEDTENLGEMNFLKITLKKKFKEYRKNQDSK